MVCFGTGLTQSNSIYASGRDIGSINSSFCLTLTQTLWPYCNLPTELFLLAKLINHSALANYNKATYTKTC